VWPALLLEHVAADEASIKGGGKRGHRMNVLVHVTGPQRARCVRCQKGISTIGKVSIPEDTAHADEAFGLFPSPARLPLLHLPGGLNSDLPVRCLK
jgi:hypothetical protein